MSYTLSVNRRHLPAILRRPSIACLLCNQRQLAPSKPLHSSTSRQGTGSTDLENNNQQPAPRPKWSPKQNPSLRAERTHIDSIKRLDGKKKEVIRETFRQGTGEHKLQRAKPARAERSLRAAKPEQKDTISRSDGRVSPKAHSHPGQKSRDRDSRSRTAGAFAKRYTTKETNRRATTSSSTATAVNNAKARSHPVRASTTQEVNSNFTNKFTEGSKERKVDGRITSSSTTTSDGPPRKREAWQVQKQALNDKFGEDGWRPRKKLSPDAMEGIRGLHEQDPTRFSTENLATQFKVSPEAIRRILRSKWARQKPEVMDDRRQRWARRHDRIWDHKAELGLRAPRTKDRTPEGPERFEEELMAKEMLGQLPKAS